MLKAINTKILLGILAALTAIGGLLVHQDHLREQQAADAARVRAILEQQQKEAEAQKKHNEKFMKDVEEKKKHAKYAGNGSKVWQTYVP